VPAQHDPIYKYSGHSTLAVVCSFGMTHNCLFFKTFNLNDRQKKLDDL
jgi:hypothetical protein